MYLSHAWFIYSCSVPGPRLEPGQGGALHTTTLHLHDPESDCLPKFCTLGVSFTSPKSQPCWIQLFSTLAVHWNYQVCMPTVKCGHKFMDTLPMEGWVSSSWIWKIVIALMNKMQQKWCYGPSEATCVNSPTILPFPMEYLPLEPWASCGKSDYLEPPCFEEAQAIWEARVDTLADDTSWTQPLSHPSLTGRKVNKETSRWFQHLAWDKPSHLCCLSPDSRLHRAETHHQCCALFEFLTHRIKHNNT